MPEILDPTTFPRRPRDRAGAELLAGRRAFPKAQALLAGAPVGPVVRVEIGWYDTGVHREVGAFGLMAVSAGMDDLVGQVVRVRHGERKVFVYVLGALILPDGVQIGLARRAFAALARPSVETVSGDVAVVK